jgi:rhodanese-related sulfurtransferase
MQPCYNFIDKKNEKYQEGKLMRKIFIALISTIFMTSLATQASAEKPDAPMSVDGATTIDTNTAKAMFVEGVAFVDVRKNSDWDAGRVPGAIHLNIKTSLNDNSLLNELESKDVRAVFYCNGAKCMRSSEAAKLAVGWGYKNIYYFRDGYPAWKNAGYPTE